MSHKKTNGLNLRIISAIVIAGPAIAAIYFGSPYFNIMIALFAILMGWEWSKLCLAEFKLPGMILSAYAGAIALLPFFDIPLIEALLIAPVICVILFALSPNNKGKLWFAIGALYLAIPVCAFIFLRSADEVGVSVVFWIACMVVATDTGGYAFGIIVGGPKLAPKISPKKTWAGLIGGMSGAFLTGLAFSFAFNWAEPILISCLSAILAVVAQMGDLFESHVKRRFDVKDSSQIIPGHGGVLDRLDGMLTASAVMAGLILATSGNILTWF